MAERTEKPTPRHLARLRRRGQVPKSAELSSAIGLMVGIYLLRSRGAEIIRALEQLMRDMFLALATQDLTPAAVQARGSKLALWAMTLMAPLVLGAMVTGVFATVVQTRGLVAPALLKPTFSRINPVNNLRQLLSRRGLVELLKDIGKIAVLGFVVFQALSGQVMSIAAASTIGVSAGVQLLGGAVYKMAVRVSWLFLVLAIIDYIYQRRQFQQSSRMTKEEVKEEMRSAEGSPLTKGRLRREQRKWALQRMMQQVPKADVVVTNPTHLAIALQYDGRTMLAPTVVAKGKGFIASQIVKIARQHRVPIVENRPLAHALIRLEIGTQIPPELYQAVAEVLAFVYRLRRARIA